MVILLSCNNWFWWWMVIVGLEVYICGYEFVGELDI